MGVTATDIAIGVDTAAGGSPRLAITRAKGSPGFHDALDLGDPFDAGDKAAFLGVIGEAAESYSAFVAAVQSTYPDAADVIGSSAWSSAERTALHESAKAMADLFGV